MGSVSPVLSNFKQYTFIASGTRVVQALSSSFSLLFSSHCKYNVVIQFNNHAI